MSKPNVHEENNRAKRVIALTSALLAVSQNLNKSPLETLAIFTDESWAWLAQMAEVKWTTAANHKETIAAVVDHFTKAQRISDGLKASKPKRARKARTQIEIIDAPLDLAARIEKAFRHPFKLENL